MFNLMTRWTVSLSRIVSAEGFTPLPCRYSYRHLFLGCLRARTQVELNNRYQAQHDVPGSAKLLLAVDRPQVFSQTANGQR